MATEKCFYCNGHGKVIEHEFQGGTREVDCEACRERAALQAEVERLKQLDSSAPMTATEVRVRNEIGGAVIKAQAERDQWRAMTDRLARVVEKAKCWEQCDCAGGCREINQAIAAYSALRMVKVECPSFAERAELQEKIDQLIARNRNLERDLITMSRTASGLLWACYHASECSEGTKCPLFIGELEIHRKVAGNPVTVPKVDANSPASRVSEARKKSR